VLPAGVPSSFQAYDPHPIVVKHASGSHMVDVDGNEYVDYDMGFGALFAGHMHPAVRRAVEAQLDEGTLYVTPCELDAEFAELLGERYGFPMWRPTNSGTDKPPIAAAGPADAPWSVPQSAGITQGTIDDVIVIPYNDAPALERALASREVACFIVEPVMENIGICLPDPGYLEAVREICTKYGTLLIFDEVKTGITAGLGGATKKLGRSVADSRLARSVARPSTWS
jgi:glutamate-1-semialdehyde 2,1-aminomutase